MLGVHCLYSTSSDITIHGCHCNSHVLPTTSSRAQAFTVLVKMCSICMLYEHELEQLTAQRERSV